jgi:uncharacterized protein YjbJ (UPF0337 family)
VAAAWRLLDPQPAARTVPALSGDVHSRVARGVTGSGRLRAGFPGQLNGGRHRRPITERSSMSDKNIDEAKGRVKEAAGSLTDNDKLRREGKGDQAKSSVKNAVDKVADKAKNAVDGDR